MLERFADKVFFTGVALVHRKELARGANIQEHLNPILVRLDLVGIMQACISRQPRILLPQGGQQSGASLLLHQHQERKLVAPFSFLGGFGFPWVMHKDAGLRLWLRQLGRQCV